MTSDLDEGPDFGPGGYLPRRAAQRARKIVLREQMGLGWPIAAVAAAVLVAVVGVVFLLTRSTPPGPPFVAIGPIDAVEAWSVATLPVARAEHDALVVRAGGGLAVFVAPEAAVVYCRQSRRLEAPGLVWNVRGRLVGGDGQSLRPLATRLHDGQLYVDPTTRTPPPAPDPAGERPVCAAAS